MVGTIENRNKSRTENVIPGESSLGMSKADKYKMRSEVLKDFESMMNALNKSADMKQEAVAYKINADFAESDATRAMDIAIKNTEIVNIQKGRSKADIKSGAAGSGILVSSAMVADRIAANDMEYNKTIANIMYEGEANANAAKFEAEQSRIQANYLETVSRNSSKVAVVKGMANMVGTVSSSVGGKE